MPRIHRIAATQSLLHVIGRGVDRRTIFNVDEDYNVFLAQAKDTFGRNGIALVNLTLMPNHFHFELCTGSKPIGDAMHRIETLHAMRFNQRYGRIGHLFQDRFKSFEVRDDAYCLQLATYISKNPVRAGLVERPSHWEWSGHNELVSGKTRFLDLRALELMTGYSAAEFRDRYLERLATPEPEPLIDPSLSEIVDRAAQRLGLSPRHLRDGSRGPTITRAKRLIVDAARRFGFKLAMVAAELNCSQAALTGLAKEGLFPGEERL